MTLKEKVVITVELDQKPKGTYWQYETNQGNVVEELLTSSTLPDYGTAALLLRAAAAYLSGSPTGQIVQAAISSCKNRVVQILNEKGSLAVESDELPF